MIVNAVADTSKLRSELGDRRRGNLERLLDPKSIAFVGGTRAISAWRVTRRKGFAGPLYMVNPLKPEIDGIATYPSVSDLPEAPDAAYVALDPEKTIATAEILSARGAGGMVVFGSGFSEIGGEGAELERELIRKAGDVAVIGPNCYGLINHVTQGSLWPIDYQAQDLPPRVAIISQSGNVAINLAQNQRSVPLTHVVSLGNQGGIQVHDLIDHFAGQPGMRAIGLYLDGLKDIPRFHDSALRALRAGVAVVVLKAGESEVSAGIAMSHTNSLAGSRELYEALFARVGVTWVRTIPDLLETLKVFATWNMAAGDRLAFFSCSGGESSMAADFADAAGLRMIQPDEAQTSALEKILPPYGFVSNPLDLTTALFGKGPELSAAAEVLMRGASDIGVLIMDFAGDDVEPGSANLNMVEGLANACKAAGKRAAVASMKPESIPVAVQRRLLEMDVLPLQGLDAGLRAVAAGARTARRRQEIGDPKVSPLLAPHIGDGGAFLDEWESKSLLANFGIQVPKGRLAGRDGVVAAAEEIGYPVVLKACSQQLPHKTEAGAVMLNLANADEVRQAAATIAANVAAYDRSIEVDRFLVEEMVEGAVAELILGIKSDPQFGPAIIIGTGGIFVELLKDARTLLLPTDRQTVAQAVRSLAGAPLFSGFRGRRIGDVDAIVDAVMGLARLTQESGGSIVEADVNPLFVLPEGRGVRAGDALVRRIAPQSQRL
jgi:acyl-CoA synthetase (NDP forming)